MRILLIIITIIFSVKRAFTQVEANSLLGVPSSANITELNNIADAMEGSIAFNKSEKKLYFFNGSSWNAIDLDKNSIGAIKYSVKDNDHDGWYKLNGRSINSLPNTVKNNAISIGFNPVLPNGSNRVLKHPSTAENNGDTGGETNTIIRQENLPNIEFSGITSEDGRHSHTIAKSTTNIKIRYFRDEFINFFVDNGNSTTNQNGAHQHTVEVSSGGSGTPIERYQPYLVVNTFVYLGE
ncbi:hypothetical protein [Tenacibaculum sp. SG-28]|uniref:hypothetical protein n=1 Tax=Tenacibaculum sp. SG-28 TaxID=754426 RepID=UPI000CF39AAC|nr:hypothetical protein [Tenacibaculum sp. SG-28]PQJ19714.1 hypothetical protein BSU00_12180 [Tenacibaculum sp. SG-28]